MLVTGTMARVEAWLAVWLAASAASALWIAPKWLESLTLHPFGPYFISGCLFYLLRTRGPSLFRVGALLAACALGTAYAVKEQSGFMYGITPLSGFIVAASVISFHVFFAAIAMTPGILAPSRWWYRLGGLTYPLYLLHARIGKIMGANLSVSHSAWTILAVELVVALAVSAIIAATIERRAYALFHTTLMQTADRLRARLRGSR